MKRKIPQPKVKHFRLNHSSHLPKKKEQTNDFKLLLEHTRNQEDKHMHQVKAIFKNQFQSHRKVMNTTTTHKLN